jgi:hypothetical protein
MNITILEKFRKIKLDAAELRYMISKDPKCIYQDSVIDAREILINAFKHIFDDAKALTKDYSVSNYGSLKPSSVYKDSR